MPVDRVRADRYLALLGFALSFLFMLAVIALAFGLPNGLNGTDTPSMIGTAPR
jgi:hypothetical protein